MTRRVERVKKSHNRREFDCGKDSLNQFLDQSARHGDKKGHVRTFVLIDDAAPTQIIGFFSLVAGAVEISSVPEELKHTLPSHRIPTILLARLAVDKRFQGQGFGHVLLIEAFLKALEVQDLVGVSLFEIDALDEEALAFYRRYGFPPALSDPMKLFLPIWTVRKIVAVTRGITHP